MDKYKNRCKIVKTALARKYGYKNVSVKQGRGTAASWTKIKIKSRKPINCTCTDYNPFCCVACKDERHCIRKEAESLAIQSGANFGVWYPEMQETPSHAMICEVELV